jgi:hypothetical protein
MYIQIQKYNFTRIKYRIVDYFNIVHPFCKIFILCKPHTHTHTYIIHTHTYIHNTHTHTIGHTHIAGTKSYSVEFKIKRLSKHTQSD